MSEYVTKAKEELKKKYGFKRSTGSISVATIIAFIICIFLIWKKPLGTWSIWIGLAVIFLACLLF